MCANAHVFSDIPADKIRGFKNELLKFFDRSHPEILSSIVSAGGLPEDLVASIVDAAKEFKASV